MWEGIVDRMNVQSLQKKFIRCCKLIRYYGVKTTVVHFLAQKFETKFSNVRNELFLDFILKLRKEIQIVDSTDEKEDAATEFSKIVWVLWQQGEAHMPETVKASTKTIKDFALRNGYEFNFLTDENLLSYVDIPKDIIEKNKRNELTSAAFSDIVRASLLYEHGGIWMDATLFVSPYATIEMFERDLFSLNHPPIHADKMGCAVSGFKWTGYCLSGKKGKPYFKHIRDLFIYFIRKYPVMIHYLMMDFFILSEYNCNPEFRVLVDELPVLAPAERVWFLRENAGKLFDEKEWEEVLRNTPIMKTTYKFDVKEALPQTYQYKLYYGELNMNREEK